MTEQNKATKRRNSGELLKKNNPPKKPTTQKKDALDKERWRGQFYSEFQDAQNTQARATFLREQHPQLFSRLAMLGHLIAIQQRLGGEFPAKVAFVHMADYVLNARRIGCVDIDSLVVALEVYEHNDIVAGIVWLPLDQIWWIGTADMPVDEQRVSLTNKDNGSVALPKQYNEIRRKIAELDV